MEEELKEIKLLQGPLDGAVKQIPSLDGQFPEVLDMLYDRKYLSYRINKEDGTALFIETRNITQEQEIQILRDTLVFLIEYYYIDFDELYDKFEFMDNQIYKAERILEELQVFPKKGEG